MLSYCSQENLWMALVRCWSILRSMFIYTISTVLNCVTHQITALISATSCISVCKRMYALHHVIRALFLLYKEAQDNADRYTNELDQLKSTLLRTEEEKKRLEDEVTQVRFLSLFILYTEMCLPIWIIAFIILIAGKGNVEEGSTESWEWKQPQHSNHYWIQAGKIPREC